MHGGQSSDCGGVKRHNRRFSASMPWPQSDCPQRPHHELWSWIRSLHINTAPSVPSFSSSILRISSALSSLIFESWILHVMKPRMPSGLIPCAVRLVITTTTSCLATHCFFSEDSFQPLHYFDKNGHGPNSTTTVPA